MSWWHKIYCVCDVIEIGDQKLVFGQRGDGSWERFVEEMNIYIKREVERRGYEGEGGNRCPIMRGRAKLRPLLRAIGHRFREVLRGAEFDVDGANSTYEEAVKSLQEYYGGQESVFVKSKEKMARLKAKREAAVIEVENVRAFRIAVQELGEVQRRIAGSRPVLVENKAELDRSRPILTPSSLVPFPVQPITAQVEISYRMPVELASYWGERGKDGRDGDEFEESLLTQPKDSGLVRVGGSSVGSDGGHGGGDGGHGGGDGGHGGGEGGGGDQESSAAEYDSSPGLLESDGTQEVSMEEDLG